MNPTRVQRRNLHPQPSGLGGEDVKYAFKPTRLAITTEGPTEAEAAVVARHWAYVQELAAKGTLIFAGRTLVTAEDGFASVVFRADSEEDARAIIEGDPGVREGVFRARLFPYQALLMGSL